MQRWKPDNFALSDGYVFAIFASCPGKAPTEVTFFRQAPATLQTFSFADPFGDSTCQIKFEQITPFDDISSSELWFLRPWTNYEIYYVPVGDKYTPSSSMDPLDIPVNIEGIHQATTTPEFPVPNVPAGMAPLQYSKKELMWEGHSVSYSVDNDGVTIQLQGALFALDRFLAKPKYPERPVVAEKLLIDAFEPYQRGLKTKPLKIEYPQGWKLTYNYTEVTPYTPMGWKQGALWSGVATRNTGAWDKLLTNYVQNVIGIMYTPERCGVTTGNTWTIRKDPNRQPVLHVRDRFRPPDFEIWYGSPGMEVSLTQDGMNITNVIYGEGTGWEGAKWSNTNIENGVTTFEPVAYDGSVYPYTERPRDSYSNPPSEVMINFGDGITLDMAKDAGLGILARDGMPGWAGTIKLQINPLEINRWMIRPGMVVNLRGFAGMQDGIRMHIAEVTCEPLEHDVTLQVDTKFRDLLTLEQMNARVKDPITPVKLLQVNRRSLMIDDLAAPWDYSAGSGFIPRDSVELFRNKRAVDTFPYRELTMKYPPKRYPQYYVEVAATAGQSKRRWSYDVPILMSQSGTIRRIELICVNKDGVIVQRRFHISIYRNGGTKANTENGEEYISSISLPHTGEDYSPFTENHFFPTAPNGQPWGPGNFYEPDSSFLIGWGNGESYAGYWPGNSDKAEALPTGMFVDEAVWAFDMTQNPDWNVSYDPSTTQRDTAKMLYAKIYTDRYYEDLYFLGRLYRVEPGQ